MPSNTMIVVDYHVQVQRYRNTFWLHSDTHTFRRGKRSSSNIVCVFFCFKFFNIYYCLCFCFSFDSIASNILDAWFSLYVLMKTYLYTMFVISNSVFRSPSLSLPHFSYLSIYIFHLLFFSRFSRSLKSFRCLCLCMPCLSSIAN